MANIVYADPFGSYTRGKEQGQQQAIGLATAQRLFRDSDREADFRKWYDPHLRKQTEMQEKQMELQRNEQIAQYLARLAQNGDPQVIEQLRRQWMATSGADIDFSKLTPRETIAHINAMANLNPAAFAFIDPNVVQAAGISRYVNTGQSQAAQQQTDLMLHNLNTAYPTSVAPQSAAPQSAAPQPTAPQPTSTAPASELSSQGAQEKIGPWAGPHPVGAVETPGGSGVIEHSYPPANTGTVMPGSAGGTGTATTAGAGQDQARGNVQPIPGYQGASPPPVAPTAPTAPTAPVASKVPEQPQSPAAPQATPVAPAEPGELFGKPGAEFDKAKAGFNALGGRVGEDVATVGKDFDYAKGGWDALGKRIADEWNYDVHGIKPGAEAPGAVYRPNVLDEPMFHGIEAGNQSQYAKNPYMPEPQKMFSTAPITDFGKAPNMVRDPAYPPAPNQNLQAADLRLPVGEKPNPTTHPLGFAGVNAGSRTDYSVKPSFASVQAGSGVNYPVTSYGKPAAVAAKGTINRAPAPVDPNRQAYEEDQRKRLGGGTY